MIEVSTTLQKDNFTLNAEFTVPGRGVTVIFGPSGCGKTSLLRAIAGLEPRACGNIKVNNKLWQSAQFSLPTHKRRLGYVFQTPSLFPHLSVQANLLFGARKSNTGTPDFNQAVELLGLESLLQRPGAELSGGEQQRVAIGRALLCSPDLLLLDEPLSALDMGSKAKLIPFLESALQALEIPALYVTHSPDEVARLADNLLLMDQGRVRGFGPVADVLSRLDSPLAVTEEAFTVLRGQVGNQKLAGLTTITSQAGHAIHIPLNPREAGSEVRIKIQARDVSLCLERPEKTSILNILPATVENLSEVTSAGNRTVKLDLAGEKLLARVSDYSCQQLQLRPGQALFAQIKSAALVY
ncbi:MAG: molybdenum ABC transporter ATP-binding protein [Gammaproteobacteria bacterium]|nr:molybdenum ABC transporter ATP-binding protein [Gammaproteobacteria bacterium]